MYSLLVTREQTTKDMLDYLKANSARVKIVALIPSAAGQSRCPAFNVVLNDGRVDEPPGGHGKLIPRLARMARRPRITNHVGGRIQLDSRGPSPW